MRFARARFSYSVTALTLAGFLASTVPNVAAAQGRDRRVVKGTTGAGRVAGIAPAQTPIVVVQPAQQAYYYPQYGYGYSSYGYFPNAGFVQNIPVVLLQDGRVFANFGYGYEQVIRTCSPGGFGSVSSGYGASLVTGGGVVQPTVVQPTATQPAPAQTTESERMLIRAVSPATVVNAMPGPLAVQVVTPSCWSNYGASVYVFHR